MHPNAFLRLFWRMEMRPQVFVAMSFAPQYADRFNNVIAPAIGAIRVGNIAMRAYRVDISKSGDSILTDIVDGVTHSQLVLADVSTIGKDAVSGRAYRNGNVMYEVGLALACRQPEEVLLLRDDADDFLFDVSTVPHMKLDFTNAPVAQQKLKDELMARLRECNRFRDARVQIALSQLSADEMVVLKGTFEYTRDTVWGREVKGIATSYALGASRLLDKQVIRVAGEFDNGNTAYQFTDLGWIVQQSLRRGLPIIPLPKPDETEHGKGNSSAESEDAT